MTIVNSARAPSTGIGRVATCLTTWVAVSFVALGVAAAEPIYAFDTTPGKLPKTVIPIHYAIELEPNLEHLTLAGREVVDIEVREPTARLVLNAVNMTLSAASLDEEAQSAAIALDAGAETATLTFAQPLAAGQFENERLEAVAEALPDTVQIHTL